jgi:hypothetical protein
LESPVHIWKHLSTIACITLKIAGNHQSARLEEVQGRISGEFQTSYNQSIKLVANRSVCGISMLPSFVHYSPMHMHTQQATSNPVLLL